MNEQVAAEPLPPYSERELTLKAISLTFQRARAAQNELGDRGNGDEADDGDDSDGQAGEPRARNPDSEELDATYVEDGDAPIELPNPIVTDTNLRHYLEAATVTKGDAETEAARSRVGTLRSSATARAEQARFNDALLNAIHQLDHRTRLQQETIARLEAELADARRALAALELDRD